MIGMTPPDRWSCPTCKRTEVPAVPEADMHAAIVRAQQLHAREHARERAARIGGER